jgi:hypothetical protein
VEAEDGLGRPGVLGRQERQLQPTRPRLRSGAATGAVWRSDGQVQSSGGLGATFDGDQVLVSLAEEDGFRVDSLVERARREKSAGPGEIETVPQTPALPSSGDVR